MKQTTNTIEKQLRIKATKGQLFPEVLTEDAMEYLTNMHHRFNNRRIALLEDRKKQQQLFDAGALPTFPPETKNIRDNEWHAAPTPDDLLDRRVEITGPVDRKMVINALNSGAKTFMADFEDSTSPTWSTLMQGQQNLIEAVNKTIVLEDVAKNKKYKLNDTTAVLLVRPRGLHLQEKHILIEDQETSGSLVDFGLYAFHNFK